MTPPPPPWLLPFFVSSDGLRTRLVFAEIALMRPHILLLDEPTNHASMEMIDSMAIAIKQFQGGVIVISHDFRLLQQVRRGGGWYGLSKGEEEGVCSIPCVAVVV